MAIVENWRYIPLGIENDPDDFRPASELAVIIDPSGSADGLVQKLTVLDEKIAPGDRIPLHEHTIEEVLFVDEGEIQVTLGKECRRVNPRAVVFIPALVSHGFENVGSTVARIRHVFSASEITIRYLERNPAPGTEGNEPGPPVALNLRELTEGEPEKAIRVLSDPDFG